MVSSKAQKFKAMYEDKFEFPGGGGVIGQILSMGGIYFLELLTHSG